MREFDYCITASYEKAGENDSLRKHLLDEANQKVCYFCAMKISTKRYVTITTSTQELAIAEMERTHREELMVILQEAQKTRIDNLLSSPIETLNKEIQKYKSQAQSLEWENKQLIERNRHSAADDSSDVEGSLPSDIVRKLDTFIVSLSQTVMQSLNLNKTLRSECDDLRKQHQQVCYSLPLIRQGY